MYLLGPFAPCHDVEDAAPYYESCVFDLCATLLDEDLVCDSFQSYTEACRSAGRTPDDWRSSRPQCRKLHDI